MMEKPKIHKAPIPHKQSRVGNRELWDEITSVHQHTYSVERFMAGGRWLPKTILEEVGDVGGQRYHQCDRERRVGTSVFS